MGRIQNTLYNLDRAIASFFGAPPQETISSMVGRYARKCVPARVLCMILNWIDPGHCKDAIEHANRLDAADDGNEQ